MEDLLEGGRQRLVKPLGWDHLHGGCHEEAAIRTVRYGRHAALHGILRSWLFLWAARDRHCVAVHETTVLLT